MHWQKPSKFLGMGNEVRKIRIGDYIETFDTRNSQNKDYPILGVNRDKEFMPTAANTIGLDTRKYKIIQKGQFVFSGMQTGRDVCIRIALYDKDTPALLSPAYTTFFVRNNELLPEFLFMWFKRTEMDRYGWFISDSSVRANLDWPRFEDIEIPLPSLEEQQELVNVWKSLKDISTENDAIAAPLEQLCKSYMQKIKYTSPLEMLGNYIEPCDERNSEGKYGLEDVRGVSINKTIINTKANMDGVSLKPYKLFKDEQFCYVSVTSRNGEKITLALNDDKKTYIVSSSYIVFEVSNREKLLPEFLFLWLSRPEFDRYARFNSWGSARETFSFEEMCRVKVPILPIEEQQAIVDLYKCASGSRKIAEKARQLSTDLCPALMQKAIRG